MARHSCRDIADFHDPPAQVAGHILRAARQAVVAAEAIKALVEAGADFQASRMECLTRLVHAAALVATLGAKRPSEDDPEEHGDFAGARARHAELALAVRFARGHDSLCAWEAGALEVTDLLLAELEW